METSLFSVHIAAVRARLDDHIPDPVTPQDIRHVEKVLFSGVTAGEAGVVGRLFFIGKNIVDQGPDIRELLHPDLPEGGEFCVGADHGAALLRPAHQLLYDRRLVQGSPEEAREGDDAGPVHFQPVRVRLIALQHGRPAVDRVAPAVLVDDKLGDRRHEPIHDGDVAGVHPAPVQLRPEQVPRGIPADPAGDRGPASHLRQGDGFIDRVPADMQLDPLGPVDIFPVPVRLLAPGDAVDHRLADAEDVIFHVVIYSSCHSCHSCPVS